MPAGVPPCDAHQWPARSRQMQVTWQCWHPRVGRLRVPAQRYRQRHQSCFVEPLSESAWSIMGRVLRMWSREASSGTTPPYSLCRSIWLYRRSAIRPFSLSYMATPVSSHELSMPMTLKRSLCFKVSFVPRCNIATWSPHRTDYFRKNPVNLERNWFWNRFLS